MPERLEQDIEDDGIGFSYEGPRCVTPDPIGVLEEEHALQLELCAVLETIADDLPDRADKELAKVAVSILSRSWPAHIALEETCLFPLLRERAKGDTMALDILDHLEAEHEHDEDFAGEIAMALQAYVDDGRIENPAMLGYMLRGFFEGQRRHVAWENATIVPLARKILVESDLVKIQSWIMSSGHPRCTHQSRIALVRARQGQDVCGTCSAYHLDK